MTTRWDPEISMARPPARRPINWENVVLLVALVCFWLTVVVVLWWAL